MGHGDWKDMFRAIQENDSELVSYYIKMDIDVNYQHPEFLTSPLIESIRCNNIPMMLLLLKNGASVKIKEAESGKDAIQIAEELNNKEVMRLLMSFSV